MHIGVWYDYSGAYTQDRVSEIVEWCENMHLSHVRIMLDDQAVVIAPGRVRRLTQWDETLRWNFTRDWNGRLGAWHSPVLDEFVGALREAGIRVILTVWPHLELGDGEQAKYLKWLEDCIWLYHPDALEVDWENYNAVRYSVDKQQKLLESIYKVAHRFDFVREDRGELHLTCIPAHLEDAIEHLDDWVDVWVPQAYATTRYDYDGPYGPGAMQRLVNKIWEQSRSTGRLVVGQAGYGQDWGEQATVTQAMDKCLTECDESGIDTVCYWSTNNLDASHRREHRELIRYWAQRDEPRPSV